MGSLLYWDERRVEEENKEIKKALASKETLTDEEIKHFQDKMDSAEAPIVVAKTDFNKLTP